MVSAPTIPRIEYDGYNAWNQLGFRAAAYAGSDLATRIEDAAALVVAQGYKKLIVPAPPSGYNNISRKIVLPANISIDLQGEVRYTGSANETAVEIGDSGTLNFKQYIRCRVTRLNQTDWSDNGARGILLHNPYNSQIDIAAEYFTIGAEVFATNFGVSHNSIQLNRLTNNRYGLRLNTNTGQSWVNQNTFYDGRWQQESDKYTDLGSPAAGVMDPVGIWFSGSGTGINNNLFISASIEMAGSEEGSYERWPQIKPVLFDCHATANRWIMARHESDWPSAQANPEIARPWFWINAANVSANVAELGYTSSILWREADLIKYMTTDTGRHLGNRVYTRYSESLNAPRATSSWTSGNLSDKAKQFNAAGALWIPGASWASSTLREPYSPTNAHTVEADYVSLTAGSSQAICWRVECTESKRFLITVDSPDTDTALSDANANAVGFRIVLVARDASNTILTNAGGAHPYIDFLGAAWTSNMGGGYQTSVWSKLPLSIICKPEVHHFELCIMQVGANNTADIKSVTIANLDRGSLQVGPVVTGFDDTLNYAAVAPESGWKGRWKTGQVILNYAASASGDPWGWRCRGNGTSFDALNP